MDVGQVHPKALLCGLSASARAQQTQPQVPSTPLRGWIVFGNLRDVPHAEPPRSAAGAVARKNFVTRTFDLSSCAFCLFHSVLIERCGCALYRFAASVRSCELTGTKSAQVWARREKRVDSRIGDAGRLRRGRRPANGIQEKSNRSPATSSPVGSQSTNSLRSPLSAILPSRSRLRAPDCLLPSRSADTLSSVHFPPLACSPIQSPP